MKNLTKQDFGNKLEKSYMGVIVPKTMSAIPLPMSDWRKWDEEGNPIDGEYHSIDTLSETFGNQFVPVRIIDDRFIYSRWSFRQNESETFGFHSFMQASGLIHVRKDLDISEVDFDNLADNSYLVVANDELSEIPTSDSDTELINS